MTMYVFSHIKMLINNIGTMTYTLITCMTYACIFVYITNITIKIIASLTTKGFQAHVLTKGLCSKFLKLIVDILMASSHIHLTASHSYILTLPFTLF